MVTALPIRNGCKRMLNCDNCDVLIPALTFLLLTATAKAPVSASQPAKTATALSDSEKLERIRQDVASLKEKRERWYADPDALLPIIGGLLIAAGGWWFAWRTTKHTTEAASRLEGENRLFDSLKLLSEGTQARGVAVALIDAYWDEIPRFQRPWVSVLTNQAIHLLTRSKERDSLVERDNVLRILDILMRHPAGRDKAAYRTLMPAYQRASLREAMKMALHPDEHEFGVRLEEPTAGRWYLRLWGVPDDKIAPYLEGQRSILSLNEDIDEHAFD